MLLALALLAPDAHAHPGHPPRRPPPPPPREAPARVERPAEHGFSVVVNVVDAPTPLLSAGVEAALGRRASVGSTLGLGVTDRVGLYDFHVDARGYALGTFDTGLFVGAGAGVTNYTPVSYGIETPKLAAFAGGKLTLPVGLTLEASVGAEAHLDLLDEAALIAPAARVGVGWSF
jgi:hypothetical protein